MARPAWLALLPVPLLAAVPASAGEFKCPEAGGPAWREVRTAHFVIQTDLSSGRAEDLAEELERVHEAVRYGLFRTPPDTGVIRVVAMADEDEYALFAPRGATAFYTEPFLSGPTIVMYGKGADVQRVVVAHEITHHVTRRVFARQPLWFGEGLACAMESVATVGTPTIGGIPAHRAREVNPYFGEVARVLRARERLETSRDYAVAWALVHYLMNRRPQELGQFQQRLARGQDPAVAWREVFPQWDPASDEAMAALDKELGRHVTRGEFRYREVTLPKAAPPSERPMTAAQAHDLRLSLRWLNRGEKVEEGKERAEIEEALRHDPGSVAALAHLVAQRPAEAVALADKATSAHPDDARAWLLLARALPPESKERREAALRKAVAADPSSAQILNELAWHLLGTGRADEALPPARRAVELSPGSSAALDTLAGVAEARGDCTVALQIQRRALELLPEELSDKERAPYHGRAERLERACGGTGPASPPAPAPASVTK
ncbi:MAG TPA: tetratricopeptide repeat protein [Anaeromyxobacteraceae bacterium]|nr:tetratricopeptide repeat protein [Anaeromyxobacteraceae bacterium]